MPGLDHSDPKTKRRSKVYSALLVAFLGTMIAGKFYVDRIVAAMQSGNPTIYIDAATQMQWLLGASAVLAALISLVSVRYGWRVIRAKRTLHPEERFFASAEVISGPRAVLQGIIYIVFGIFTMAMAISGVGVIWMLETLKRVHL